MSESRTQKASRNVIIGIGSRFILMLFAFATKTVFIRLLGIEYNGVAGLYNNIISLLALSELGVGNVLNYALYSALKEGDIERVKSLVSYFRKIYHVIALCIFAVGLAVVPFLEYIINSDLPHDELIVYYIFYLINSVASYLVVYKTTVIIADQNNYINSICEIAATIIMHVCQIVYLLFCRDFLGYLIIQVIFTVLRNVALSFIANRKYPYLKGLRHVQSSLDNTDKERLKTNIRSTFLYKIAAVILNNTDNILISIIVGTVFVGYYSNYYMIVNYLSLFISIFIMGITASLGNLNSYNDNEASYKMFKVLCLIFSFIGTVIVCCLLNCLQQFIPIWIGKEHVMGFSWVIVIALNLYLNTIMNPIWMFRETMGLFRQVRYIMLITAGLNILFSIILGCFFGVPGIISATFLAKLVSQYWYEPKILFGKLNQKVGGFYKNQIKQVLTMLLASGISMAVCHYIGSDLISLFLRAVISALIAVTCVYLFNRNSEAMKQLIEGYAKPFVNKYIVSALPNRRK